MTSIFDDKGRNIPCTVIEAGPCVVTQIKTDEVDGYNAVQLGYNDKNEKHSNKAEAGHFSKSKSTAKYKLVEFQNFDQELNLGDSVSVDHFVEESLLMFQVTQKVKVFKGLLKDTGLLVLGKQLTVNTTDLELLDLLVLPLSSKSFQGYENGR